MMPRCAGTVLAIGLMILTIEVGVGRTPPPAGGARVSIPVLGSGTHAGTLPSPSAQGPATGAPARDAGSGARADAATPAPPAPAAPTHLTAVGGDHQVALSWRPAALGAPGSSWIVRRASADGGAWRTIARLPASRTTYLDRPLPNCVPCKYLIYAVDPDGTPSREGAEVGARPEGPPPAPPVGLAGLLVGAGQVRLSWRSDPDEPLAAVEIYRSASAGEPGRLVGVVAAPVASWVDPLDPTESADRRWPRYYSLRARDRCGRLGPPGLPVCVTPRATD